MKRSAGPILINIGFGNVVSAHRVVAVVSPDSLPMKRLREEARRKGKLIDATEGRKTRAIIITDSDHVILSALQTETITQRISGEHSEEANSRDAVSLESQRSSVVAAGPSQKTRIFRDTEEDEG